MKMHLDPRTKLFLILLCVLSAVFAPNLYFQFVLVTFIGLLAAVNGKWRYALRGIFAYALICAFTVWCMVIYALSDFLIMILSWLVKQSLRAFCFRRYSHEK